MVMVDQVMEQDHMALAVDTPANLELVRSLVLHSQAAPRCVASSLFPAPAFVTRTAQRRAIAAPTMRIFVACSAISTQDTPDPAMALRTVPPIMALLIVPIMALLTVPPRSAPWALGAVIRLVNAPGCVDLLTLLMG